MGAALPTMTTEEGGTKQQAESTIKTVEVHPPTGRLGKAVSEMTEETSGGKTKMRLAT